MARNADDNNNDNDDARRVRDRRTSTARTETGFPLLAFCSDGVSPARRPSQRGVTVLQKGQVRFDPSLVSFIYARGFPQLPFTFGILRRKQMAARGLRSQDLAARSDLEPLGDGFACLTACDWLRHEAPKVNRTTAMTIAFCTGRRPRRQ
jgi:hypothetical protein